MIKIYEALWAMVAVIAAITFVTGNMTLIVGVAFGLVCFGLIFMGMMFVLPSTVHDLNHPEPVTKVEKVKHNEFVPQGAVHVR